VIVQVVTQIENGFCFLFVLFSYGFYLLSDFVGNLLRILIAVVSLVENPTACEGVERISSNSCKTFRVANVSTKQKGSVKLALPL